ncbi:hypothetical protein Q7F20_07875 [Curtobacterium sp. A7_M15]|uniref:hypothetical protein n=1 Tax=Curtobacterium sp. A7_M15 TaxID=3065241 RepID=UPI002737ED40|nr:hypothetical protein [Curtobacterium sp. A7_M15]MDP4333286.1 hypothetical protein [Curtobacterium sp. A7_M15]
MTTYQPRTLPVPPISPVEVLTNRLGTALVRWSLRHAERRALRAVTDRKRAYRRALGQQGSTTTSTTTDLIAAELRRRW